MKVRSKAVALLTLTLLLAVAAAGCGSGDDQGAQPRPSTSATTPPTPTASSPTGQPSTGQSSTGQPSAGQSSAGQSSKPVPSSTAMPAEMSDADKQTLLAVLGTAATAQLCEPGPGTRVECGRVFVPASRLVTQLQASVKSMPKTKPYNDFAGQLALFQKSYSLAKKLGCFGKEAPKNPDICQSIVGLAASTYLVVTTVLLY